ncbi:hypothetical protein JTE90_019000 [Oedothorax gibbosus]|uniref:Uncharacterized protein n=1 Tax=Oedothorax gibbosus TaxID=931172 RepID=A0AAV6U4P3_9ARAC|nr:hypothetical protein JTE90_019000 [Oedothorax gibbosus]
MTGFEQSTSRFSTRRCLHGYYIYCSNPTNFFSSLSSCFGRFFCACGERDEFPGVYMITPPMYGEPLDPRYLEEPAAVIREDLKQDPEPDGIRFLYFGSDATRSLGRSFSCGDIGRDSIGVEPRRTQSEDGVNFF